MKLALVKEDNELLEGHGWMNYLDLIYILKFESHNTS